MSDNLSLFIRLYLDEDVHKRIANALRLRHFDVISAHETDRLGTGDDAQLRFAAEQARALFTFIRHTTSSFITLGSRKIERTLGSSSLINSLSAKPFVVSLLCSIASLPTNSTTNCIGFRVSNN